MLKVITSLAAVLVLVTATVATAAPPAFGHSGQETHPTVRRFSYQPGMAPAPVYRTYRYVRPVPPHYLLPKTDVRRFST